MSEIYYYSNFNTLLIFFIIIILISSAVGIYRNAMWRARLEQGNVQVVYYRHGAAVIQPYPPGPYPPGTAPPAGPGAPHFPAIPSDGQMPSAPPPAYGKPPPYAAVA